MTEREKFIALLSTQPLRSADAIFLAEGDGYHRVPHVADLFKNNFAPTIATVGGDTRREYGSFISSELKKELIDLGMPSSAIVCEDTAANTKAEADRVMELARERGWRRILLVTSPHHQYRLFLTFVASMRTAGLDLVLINAPAPLPWFAENPWGRRVDLLTGEFDRIDAYQVQGDVASYEDGIRYLEKIESSL